MEFGEILWLWKVNVWCLGETKEVNEQNLLGGGVI